MHKKENNMNIQNVHGIGISVCLCDKISKICLFRALYGQVSLCRSDKSAVIYRAKLAQIWKSAQLQFFISLCIINK